MGSKEAKSGRNYVRVAPRRPATHMLLLGRPLLSLDSGGKLPLKGDVIRFVRGRHLAKDTDLKRIISCPLMKGTTSVSCYQSGGCIENGPRCAVAEVKEDSWLKSGIPLKTD